MSEQLRARVSSEFPRLVADLKDLISIPSVSKVGYPESTHAELAHCREHVEGLLRDSGFTAISHIELPETAPVIFAEIPAPEGAPTVLLYSHYDVVPVGDESLWQTPPFEPVEKDGAIFGRGSADTKSNIMAIIGSVRAWDGRPPVGVKVVIEGLEEVGGGAFTNYPQTDPERFAADVMVIADTGNVRPGSPALTATLRGMANVEIEVRTLASAKHSGQYGGAAPDALLTVIRALSTLHDEAGDVAVAGLRRDEWTGGGPDDVEFRQLAEVAGELPLMGTGTLGSRVWTGPAITVIGIDVPSVDAALNAVSPYARALLNVRVHPEQDPLEAQNAVIAHLQQAMPFGIELTVTPGATGFGYAANPNSPAYAAADAAWSEAWGGETELAGQGGSIPLVRSLHEAAPQAEILLAGTTDGYANIHGPNERVMLDEFEKATFAFADLFARLAGSETQS